MNSSDFQTKDRKRQHYTTEEQQNRTTTVVDVLSCWRGLSLIIEIDWRLSHLVWNDHMMAKSCLSTNQSKSETQVRHTLLYLSYSLHTSYILTQRTFVSYQQSETQHIIPVVVDVVTLCTVSDHRRHNMSYTVAITTRGGPFYSGKEPPDAKVSEGFISFNLQYILGSHPVLTLFKQNLHLCHPWVWTQDEKWPMIVVSRWWVTHGCGLKMRSDPWVWSGWCTGVLRNKRRVVWIWQLSISLLFHWDHSSVGRQHTILTHCLLSY